MCLKHVETGFTSINKTKPEILRVFFQVRNNTEAYRNPFFREGGDAALEAQEEQSQNAGNAANRIARFQRATAISLSAR